MIPFDTHYPPHTVYVCTVQIWLPYNGPDVRCVFVCLPLYKNPHIIISSKHTISATEASTDVLNRVGGQLSAHSGNNVLLSICTLMICEDIPLQHPAPQRFAPTIYIPQEQLTLCTLTPQLNATSDFYFAKDTLYTTFPSVIAAVSFPLNLM